MHHVEEIKDGTGRLLAIIVRGAPAGDGIRFFTHPEDPLQLGFMRHAPGKVIPAHVQAPRQIHGTTEVLLVKSGRLKVDLYGDGWEMQSTVLEAGDVAVLIAGGHGFEALEEVEAFEVKQGPYLGDKDKMRITDGSVSKA